MTTPHAHIFTIDGRPISKKNSRRIISAGGKPYLLPSKAFERFKESAIYQLRQQRKKPIEGQLYIGYQFFIKGKHRVDADNLIASINDCLEDAGLIENDNDIVAGQFQKLNGSDNWHTELTISLFNNSVRKGGEK